VYIVEQAKHTYYYSNLFEAVLAVSYSQDIQEFAQAPHVLLILSLAPVIAVLWDNHAKACVG